MKPINELTCDVTTDLMVLYTTRKTSPETKQLVEAHLGACTACARAFGREPLARENIKLPKPNKPSASETFLDKVKYDLLRIGGFLLFLISRLLIAADNLLRRFGISTTVLKIRLYRARRKVAGMITPQTAQDAGPAIP